MIARPVVRSKSTRNGKMTRDVERIPLWAALLARGKPRIMIDRWRKGASNQARTFEDTLDTVKGILTVACEEDIM